MEKTIHEKYIDKVQIINPKIKVVGKYINNCTKIKHLCVLDNYEWDACPRDILSGCGCPLCRKKVIGPPPKYINSIWASEFQEYFSEFLTYEQMISYMPYSGKTIVAKCPNCGTTKKTTPALLIRRGIKCQMCSDGISYPNKFSRAFISQINDISRIEYEYSPNWLVVNGNKCFYDIYFEYNNKKYIIEIDGKIGHGNSELFCKENGVHTLEHDREKDFLARQHNIQVIHIDATKSDAEYLMYNILNSELSKIFDFDNINIDWNYCKRIATSSFMVEAGKLWDKGMLIKDIASTLHISRTTVKRYLIILSDANICTYSKEKARNRVGKIKKGKNNPQSKRTIRLSDLKIYESAREAANDNNLSKDMIYFRCKHHIDFMYYNDWRMNNE